MYGDILQQQVGAIPQGLLMMYATKQHQRMENNEAQEEEEEKEEDQRLVLKSGLTQDALSMAPAHQSFSDTMELTMYLHRRVLEVSERFRYCPLRILVHESPNPSPAGLFPPTLLHQSNPQSKPAIANSQPTSGASEESKAGSDATEGGNLQASLSRSGVRKTYEVPNSDRDMTPSCEIEGIRALQTHKIEGKACSWNVDPIQRATPVGLLRLGMHERDFTHVSDAACLLLKNCSNQINVDTQTLEGKSRTRLACQSPVLCLSPSCKNFQNKPRIPCHPMRDNEKLSLLLRLPSLHDHAILDAEYGGMTMKNDAVHEWPHEPDCEVPSEKFTDKGVLQCEKSSLVDLVSQDDMLPSMCAGAHTSSIPTHLPHSLSSVDSSGCDICKLDAENGHVAPDRCGTKVENKMDEIDATSEARCLETDQKDEVDDEGTILVTGAVATPAGMQETKNDALDLLFNGVQEELVRGARSCPLQAEEEDGGSLRERKESFAAKVFHRTKKGQPHMHERVNGSICLSASSCYDLPSTMVPLTVQKFPYVRKRTLRHPKPYVKVATMPSRNYVVKFKSLQAVSEMDYANQKELEEWPVSKHYCRNTSKRQEIGKSFKIFQSHADGNTKRGPCARAREEGKGRYRKRRSYKQSQEKSTHYRPSARM